MKNFVYLILLLICISCNTSKPATFGKVSQDLKEFDLKKSIFRIYFDGEGSVYPTSDLFRIEDEDLIKNRNGFLINYFSHHDLSGKVKCRFNEYQALLKHYNQPINVGDSINREVWTNLQRAMRKDLASKINQVIKENNYSEIVILIHGFNVDDPTKRYDSAISVINRHNSKYLNKPPLFLEVFWDGRVGLPLLEMWKSSQANAYLVGMALRPILHDLPSHLPIRILTHSTGGPLICASLWNNYSKLVEPYPTIWDRSWNEVTHDSIDYPTPVFKNLRVGMIVPAMPGLTFFNYGNRRPMLNLVGCNETFIIGQNKKDFATRKFSISSSNFGSTTLAVNKEEYDTAQAYLNMFQIGNSKIHRVDFKSPNNEKFALFWDDHDFNEYLHRDSTSTFLNLLFK